MVLSSASEETPLAVGAALDHQADGREALAEGRVVQLLPDLPVPSKQATALFAKTHARSATLRAVIDELSMPR